MLGGTGSGGVWSLKRQVGCICVVPNSGTVCDWRQARPRHYSWRRDTVRLILLLYCNNKPTSPQCSRTDGQSCSSSWTPGVQATVLPGKRRLNWLLNAKNEHSPLHKSRHRQHLIHKPNINIHCTNEAVAYKVYNPKIVSNTKWGINSRFLLEMFSESYESPTKTAHACMSTRCLEIQPRTCYNDPRHPTELLSSVHKQAHKQNAPCDITAFVCVIIEWVWQVVFLPAALAASVPHSDSLVEFLRELMGRSGRGSRTSAVWDLTEPIRLTSGQDRG